MWKNSVFRLVYLNRSKRKKEKRNSSGAGGGAGHDSAKANPLTANASLAPPGVALAVRYTVAGRR